MPRPPPQPQSGNGVITSTAQEDTQHPLKHLNRRAGQLPARLGDLAADIGQSPSSKARSMKMPIRHGSSPRKAT